MIEATEDELLNSHLIFGNKTTFQYLSHYLFQRDCTLAVWGTEEPYVAYEHERDTFKVNIFSAIFKTKVIRPLFFAQATVQEAIL